MTIMPIQERASGSWTSGAWVVAAGGVWQISFPGIPLSDALDSSKSLSIRVEFDMDGNGSWREMMGGLWRGQNPAFVNKLGITNPPPLMGFDLTSRVGLTGRIQFEVEGPLTFGVDVVRIG